MADEHPRQLLIDMLAELDRVVKLDRFEVTAALERVAKAAKVAGETVAELRYELIAAYLVLYDEPCEWGTHFGPEFSQSTADGRRIDSPPLEAITAACVTYWGTRMNAASHPALRARYGDLVWSFSQKAAGKKPPIQAAHTAIDNYIDTIVNERADAFDGTGDLQRRAVCLAASVDPDRLRRAVEALQKHATSGPESDREHRQLELFGLLMELRGNRRPDAALDALASDLRARFDRQHDAHADQFTMKDIALPLADYYRSVQQPVESKAVLRMYGAAVERISAEAAAMLGSAWLRGLHDLYERFEMHEEAEALLPKIEAKSANIKDELKHVSQTTTIPEDKLDEAIEELISGSKGDVLFRLAANFLPSVDDTRKLVKDIASKSFVMNVFTQEVVTDDGRVTASIGPISSDLEGHVVQQLNLTIQFLSQLYRPTLERAIDRHRLTSDDFVTWLRECPLYTEDRVPLLRRVFAAYLSGEWETAIHVAIPQIESALRRLLALCNQPLIRPHRQGTFHLKNLDEVLRDPVVERALPADVKTYLRTLLCDQRGLNIRNNVCHGLWGAAEFNFSIADRVIHAILVIGLLRPQASEGEASPPPS
jgi:hypothetical protein